MLMLLSTDSFQNKLFFKKFFQKHYQSVIWFGYRSVSPDLGRNSLQRLSNLAVVSWTVTKPVLSGHSKRRPKMFLKTDYRFMQVKSIAECSKGSILQYFRPSLSYHLSLRSLFCLFLSGRLRQVLLYPTKAGFLVLWFIIS